MAAIIATAGFYFSRPLWLLALALLVPMVWWGLRHMQALTSLRRGSAIGLRVLGVILLVALLARLTWRERSEQVTVLAVLDRSQSLLEPLQQAARQYLLNALPENLQENRFAVVDVAESATIAKLPSNDPNIPRRNTTLTGDQTHLARGIQMAMAIAPPDAGVRMLLASEGNQTAGDVLEAARVAAVNRIPIDVLPLTYRYEREVVFRHLAAPTQARSRETAALRFVLESTHATRGQLQLLLNGQPLDLDPSSDQLGVDINLDPGTNVKTVSVPLGTRGIHEFEAVFVPANSQDDPRLQNNRATAVTRVAGPGHIRLLYANGPPPAVLLETLRATDMEVRVQPATELPDRLHQLMDVDALVLVNVDASQFTFQQQEMLQRYVTELGGGLAMVGGALSFGAGGWIGSPLADILPVDLDPPQKKQLPKGALVLVLHACEMPQGNYWGKRVAVAAIQTLSRRDLVGLLAYDWQGQNDWVYPLSEAGDKGAVIDAIERMQMGDLPDLGAHLQQAYDALIACDARQRHIVVISDGDPQGPSRALLDQMTEAGITCSGVAVFPHNQSDINSLVRVAQVTGGRFYQAMDPATLPQIFIKEAQVVQRSLIREETFAPRVTYGLSDILQGLGGGLPPLDGYVVTAAKGGLAQVVLASDQDDPILATMQAGLGRTVAFTSSADGRWAAGWLGWPGYASFWEQVVRWVGKPLQSRDCDVNVDIQGREVSIHVETAETPGGFTRLQNLQAKIIDPDMQVESLPLPQIGPGQFQSRFEAKRAGSYIINVQYQRANGSVGSALAFVSLPFAPEFADLSDNRALLIQVAALTGGRVLPSSPEGVNLFDTTGLRFPETQQPLTQTLLMVWLVVFLLDVAVRRLAFDWAAWVRRLIRWRRTVHTPTQDPTLERLRSTRQQIRQQRTGPGQRDVAAQRFEAANDTVVSPTQPPMAAEAPKQKPAAPQAAPPSEKPTSHIDQLLRAKRRTRPTEGEDESTS